MAAVMALALRLHRLPPLCYHIWSLWGLPVPGLHSCVGGLLPAFLASACDLTTSFLLALCVCVCVCLCACVCVCVCAILA